ncbi:MAG: flagellar filament capping protein FliD [Solirubrobacteraceae bacterium]|nr:flagellar filament capping protein FliD [Solirubrobacteraceae bacterium]
MAGISLSGLASGMDTNSLVSSILAAEGTGRTRLANQQTQMEQRASTLQSIQSKLSALKTASSALRSVTNWVPTQTVETSDASMLAATRTGGAGAGSYVIDIKSLASSSQKTFTFNSPAADGTLSFGATSVNISAGATIDDAVSAINQAGGDVIAVNAQGKLVVSSATTGAASTFAFSDSGGSTLALDSERLGRDMEYTVDGGASVFSATNTAKDALPGLDITGKKLGVASVTVGAPGPDKDALASKMKAFVEAYNSVLDAAHAATTEKPVKDATLQIDIKKGVLFGDQGLSRMVSQLRIGMSDAVAGLSGTLTSMADLGITTGATTGGATSSPDSLKGKLVFDETKFKAALDANPAGVRELLGAKSGTDGFAQKFEGLLAPQLGSGSGITDRIEQVNSQVSRLKTSLVKFDERLSTREDQLRKQFAAMETALAAAQARQADLTSRLSSLSNNN